MLLTFIGSKLIITMTTQRQVEIELKAQWLPRNKNIEQNTAILHDNITSHLYANISDFQMYCTYSIT